ncbi:MAG: ABC transporter ATP-binding protein [Deltaproteobacteria bacterium]|nr:ABC transporter ATP-binding protein [Candidatus Zymogenaceae bacterium]
MIEVKNLTKYYGPHAALKDLSFSVKQGETLGFLGPNGAGKTTTMSILTCLFPSTSGTASVAGFNVQEDPIKVKQQIGYLPENIYLYTDMTVIGYLKFVAEIKGIPKKERERVIKKVVDLTEINAVAGRGIKKLSRGYLQRVGIAQALLGDPPILIFDEPTIGLDPMQIISIRKLIKSLAGQRTIILCSHILPEVSQVCGRVIIINEGELIAVDTPANLGKRMKGKGRVIITVQGPVAEITKTLSGVPGVAGVTEKETGLFGTTYHIESKDDRELKPDLARAVVQNNFKLIELKAQDVTLEDIFIKLVTEETEA